jgi:TolB-like protein
MNLVAEIQRRKVAQWLLAYAAGAWVALQVLGLMVDTFEWPRLVMRIGVLVAVTGSAVALILAWHHGERGVQAAPRNELLALAVVLLLGGAVVWRFAGTPTAAPAAPAAAAATPAASASAPAPAPADDKSIAVLPFTNLSGGEEDGLFADGLSEEIINSLTRVPDLQVAARSSSFALRGSTLGATELAAKLRVSHVLEGSVRRAGDRVRISVQLIRARDGFNAWTETYDRSSQDIIAIQEDVARSIALALKTVTDPKALAQMQRAGTRSVPAFAAYLKGLALQGKSFETGNMDYRPPALEAFDLAVSLDPDFMEARKQAIDIVRGSLDVTSFNARASVSAPYKERMRDFKRRLDEASEHAADPATASYLQSQRALVDLRIAEALRLLQRYLQANPDSVEALLGAEGLARTLGQRQLAREFLERVYRGADDASKSARALSEMGRLPDHPRAAAMARESLKRFPGNAGLAYQSQRALLSAGDTRGAAALLPLLLASEVDDESKVLVQMRQACGEGRRHDAEVLFARIDKPDAWDPLPRWHGLLLLGRTAQANQMLAKYDRPGELYAILPFMSYPKFDITAFPNLRAELERQGVPIRPVEPEPYNCPAAGTTSP